MLLAYGILSICSLNNLRVRFTSSAHTSDAKQKRLQSINGSRPVSFSSSGWASSQSLLGDTFTLGKIYASGHSFIIRSMFLSNSLKSGVSLSKIPLASGGICVASDMVFVPKKTGIEKRLYPAFAKSSKQAFWV